MKPWATIAVVVIYGVFLAILLVLYNKHLKIMNKTIQIGVGK